MLPTVTIYQAKICCMLHIKSSKALDLHNIWLWDLWDIYEATNWRVDEQAVSFKISCILSQFDCLDDHGCGEWNDHSHQMPPLVGTEIIPTSMSSLFSSSSWSLPSSSWFLSPIMSLSFSSSLCQNKMTEEILCGSLPVFRFSDLWNLEDQDCSTTRPE